MGRYSIQVANPSFSQMSSHHCHRDEIAEPLVRDFVRDVLRDLLALFGRTAVFPTTRNCSRKKMAPVFSMAPAEKSGTATMSSFSKG